MSPLIFSFIIVWAAVGAAFVHFSGRRGLVADGLLVLLWPLHVLHFIFGGKQ